MQRMTKTINLETTGQDTETDRAMKQARAALAIAQKEKG